MDIRISPTSCITCDQWSSGVQKIALKQAGHPITQLSRPTHGICAPAFTYPTQSLHVWTTRRADLAVSCSEDLL